MRYSVIVFIAVLVGWLAVSHMGKIHVEIDYVGNKAMAAQLEILELNP